MPLKRGHEALFGGLDTPLLPHTDNRDPVAEASATGRFRLFMDL